MTELPPGSGLPAWAWNSHGAIATAVVVAALASAIAGAVAIAAPRPGAARRGHAIVAAAAGLVLAAWTAAAALASAAPAGGRFCFAAAEWVTQPAPTCVDHRPVWLLAAPLAVALAVTAAGLALALWHHRPRVALAIGAAAVAGLVAVIPRPALVPPGVFDAGGFTSALGGFARLVEDPIAGVLGLAAGIALVLVPRALRTRGVIGRDPGRVE